MGIFNSLIQKKEFHNKIDLKKLFNSILNDVESGKGDMHLATIFELISDKLGKKNINSIICIINEKRNEVVVRHINFPGDFKKSFTTKNIKEIKFDSLRKYQQAIREKQAVFCQNRLSDFQKYFPQSKQSLKDINEMNSIICPLVLRGEIIGTLEILSIKLKKEDIELIHNFVKKLVISITNNILFHEIRESEKRYRELFQHSSDGLVFFNLREKKFKESNIQMTRLSSYTNEELKQISYLNLFIQKDKKIVEEKIASVKNSKNNSKLPISFFCKIKTKYNKIKIVNCEISFSNINKDEICFNFLDVTEKKITEQALRDSEEKYRMLVDNAEDGVLVINKEGVITFVNKSFTNILEGNEDGLLNKSFKDFLYEEDRETVRTRFKDRVSGKDVVSNYDFRIKTLKNTIKYINYSGTTIKKNGEIIGVQAIIRDISKKMSMQKKIQTTKRHYKSIIDSIKDDILVISPEYKIISCNKSFAKNMGTPINQIVGQALQTTIINYKNGVLNSHFLDNSCDGKCNYKKVFKSGKVLYFTEKSADNGNGNIYNAVSIFPIKKEKKVYQAVVTIKDVTASKKAEEENQRLTEFNQKILNSSPVSILVLDKKGKIILSNNMARKIMRSDDLIGKNLIKTKEIKNNHQLIDKYKHLFKNGSSFFYDNLSYSKGKDYQENYLNIIAVPLFDNKKNVSGAISMAIDNTEKVIANQKLESLNRFLEEKVKQRTDELDNINKELSKVLELKSKFISDASHELRTPLTIIQGNLDLSVREHISKKENIPEALTLITKEVEQMTGILSDLTLLTNTDASSETISFDKISINLLLNAVSQSLSILAEQKKIKLKIKTLKEDIHIIGDEAKLEKLLLNIIRNAIKYTENGGNVEIYPELIKEEKKVIINIKDNGLGIPENDLPYIFERFYRVDKARSRKEGGTGLGLSICKWIAEAHKGNISVESKEGIGSTFSLELPFDCRE